MAYVVVFLSRDVISVSQIFITWVGIAEKVYTVTGQRS